MSKGGSRAIKIHRVVEADAVSEMVTKFWPGVRLVNAEGDTLCMVDDEYEARHVLMGRGDELPALNLFDLDWAGV